MRLEPHADLTGIFVLVPHGEVAVVQRMFLLWQYSTKTLDGALTSANAAVIPLELTSFTRS